MGGSNSKKQKQDLYKNWKLVKNGDLFNIVRDNNGEEGQQYKYILNNKFDPHDEENIYDIRRNSQAPIIKAHGYQYASKGTTLRPIYHFSAITERIPHNLSTIPQLYYTESLYVLDRSLQGYEQLYEKVGAFHVNSKMIGLTPKGQIKVWLNQNYGINHPSHDQTVLQSTQGNPFFLQSVKVPELIIPKDEGQMIRNIVNVVEDKCQQGRFPQIFASKIKSPLLGFKEARQVIRQTVREENILVPNYIDVQRNLIKVKSGTLIKENNKYVNHDNNTYNHGQYYNQGQPTLSHVRSGPIFDTRPNYYPNSGSNRYQYSNSNIPYRNSPYQFYYITPKERDHPSIFASRIDLQ